LTTHEYNAALHRDFLLSVIREQLGIGRDRRVFANELLPDCVIKLEDGYRAFQNVIEWDTWDRVKGTKWACWFAPCVWISQCGAVLVMKRTTPARQHEYPERVPMFLTDLKRANYGLLGKRLVCHDYGTNMAYEHGLNDRMRRADWWDS
jgi:hypothetical protein